MSLIYHYTSGDGLLGIITHKQLWATDINFLNDYREYKEGIDRINEFCNNQIQEKKFGVAIDLAVEGFYKLIPSVVNENIVNRKVYITSFTNKRDNLRQWMAYCKQNSGYCIGFKKEYLENCLYNDTVVKDELVIQLRDVDYSSDLSYLNKKISAIELIKSLTNGSDTQALAQSIITDLMLHSCACKPHQFYDEDECRLVAQTRKNMTQLTKYRERSGVIIPYIGIPITDESIEEIIIGPNVNSELAYAGISQLLESKNIKCKVVKSECSLRVF